MCGARLEWSEMRVVRVVRVRTRTTSKQINTKMPLTDNSILFTCIYILNKYIFIVQNGVFPQF